jgi:hypothetical protein
MWQSLRSGVASALCIVRKQHNAQGCVTEFRVAWQGLRSGGATMTGDKIAFSGGVRV